MADREVKVRISGDASSAVDAFDKAKKSAGDFEKSQASLISSIKGQWLAASAAIATATMAINKAWDMAKVGAAYSEQYGILDNLANKYKTTADDIVTSMQKASDGLIAKADLMQVALGGIAKGLKPDQMVELANAAKLLGDTVGQSATESLKGLSEALETGRMKALKGYMGSTIDLKDAFGDLADKLTAAEKAQAMYDLIIQHSTELQNQQNKAVDEAADTMERMEADYNNAKLAAGGFFKEIIVYAYRAGDAITDLMVRWERFKAGDLSTVLPGKSKQATSKGNMINNSGDLSADQLAELDMTLLKRNAASRVTPKVGGGRSDSNDAAREAARLAREQERARKEAEREAEKAEKDRLDALHEQAEAQMKLNADMLAGAEKYRELMAQMNIDIAEGHEAAVMRIMEDDRKMYENITKLMDDGVISFDEAMKAWEELAKKTGKSIQEIIQEDLTKATETFKDQLRDLSDGFDMLSGACRDMASIYDEGSASARKWEEAAKTMEIAQRAVAVVQAVAAIATQGLGDPYTAFARIAAMAATMGALLATIGESVNGGGSSSASLPASTVLGAEAGTQSESVSKSFELLEDIYDVENTRLTNIYNELRDLNNNITGLVTSIVRTGGFTAGMGIKTGTTSSYWANAGSYHINQNLGILSTIGNFLNAPAAGVIKFLGEGIFGGGTTTKIKERGLAIDSATLADILSGGVSAQQYAKLKTTTDGGWFGSDKTSYSYKYQDLDSGVSQMLNLVFQSLGSSIVSLSEAFGVDTKNALDYVFKETKLNLKGMTSEEMNTAISEYISTISDNAAQALFGDLIGKYQQLNEGLMETATRVLRNKEIIAEYLEKTNQAFTGTTEQIIGFTESLVDLGGTLDDLTENINTYINAFYSEAEQQAMLQQDLMEAMGGNMPGSRAGFRAMVEGLDLTTEAGQRAYVTMMNLAGSFDKYFSYIEDEAEKALQAAEEARQARLEQISSEYELRANALTEAYNKNLEAAQARLSAITEIVGKLTAARERMKIQDAAIEAMQFRGAKSNLMRGIWTDASLDTLTGINPGMYSTRQDYLRDYYDIYNQLGALESDAMNKKNAAERTVDWLKRQYDLDLQNLELQRTQAEALVAICNQCTGTKISGYAEGGIATGWALVGEKGPELVNFGASSRVYSNRESKSLMANDDLIAEVKALREEVRAGNTAVAGWTYKTYRTLDKFDYDGLPATRT